jgi:transcriptional regulator with XRE-family HTH domain
VVIHGLAAIRSERLLTQERLEEMAGVDRKTIMRAEAGLPIRFSSAERLAAALKISPKRLLRVPPESN